MAAPKQEPEVDFFTQAEDFFEKNKKMITIGGSALLVVVIGLIAFFGMYVPSKEKDAQSAMHKAQGYFEIDSFKLALNGDGTNAGFLTIIDDYGFTKASNLAKYYAGICYLRTGDYDNAITYLKKFSGKEQEVSAAALGALGDAYSEKNEMDEAISYYKKAAAEANDELLAPIYLMRAGLALKTQGKKEEALKIFQQIKNEYPNSDEGRTIDMYIAMVS